jgi:hypothetical protein
MNLPGRISLCLLFVFIAANVKAQHSLKKLWETDSTLNIPESVLPQKGMMYVSLIDGESWSKDGKGGVAQVSNSGKIINANWITGLNAPKGLARYGDKLYIGDMDEVVVVSISQNKIDHKIKIKGGREPERCNGGRQWHYIYI